MISQHRFAGEDPMLDRHTADTGDPYADAHASIGTSGVIVSFGGCD